MQKLKTILKKVGNAIAWAYSNSAEWGTIIISFFAIYSFLAGNYLQCALFIGFAILYALWDIHKARIANPVGIKLKYWVKMRRNCLEFGLRTVNKQGYLHATPEQDVIEIADKYFNYMLSGKVPAKEEEAATK